MIIDKSHSKTDLIDLINDLDLPIVHSHQDNKKDLQDKFIACMNENFKIKDNFYEIKTKQQLIDYLQNKNPKKILSIKEKQDVMKICKKIIRYCKINYDITMTDYNDHQAIIDDMDYIKQFGDIPSVRRCCRLMNQDINMKKLTFNPLISPQVKKDLEEKRIVKQVKNYKLTIRYATEEEPIIISFD